MLAMNTAIQYSSTVVHKDNQLRTSTSHGKGLPPLDEAARRQRFPLEKLYTLLGSGCLKGEILRVSKWVVSKCLIYSWPRNTINTTIKDTSYLLLADLSALRSRLKFPRIFRRCFKSRTHKLVWFVWCTTYSTTTLYYCCCCIHTDRLYEYRVYNIIPVYNSLC